MVKLTFIRQSGIDEDDIGLTVKTAERVYLLSKALKEKFGTPDLLYASKEFRAYLMAKISCLGFGVSRLASYSALRNDAEKREIRAFFDFVLSEASSFRHKHVVIVCDENVFNFAYIQLPAVGNSVTICGDNWKNLLQEFYSSWSPLKSSKLSVEDANFVADKIINATCNSSESTLIQKTIIDALDEYTP